ncbi:hypothetical protein J2TS4_29600 [Paenibacillus sp. J2TS4]|nr:hypothetical protein J2TS4_29600 [Paenibacillus sp. J2TS4]
MNLFGCFIIFLLLIPGSIARADQTKSAAKSSQYRLLIYYGIPQGVNELWEDKKAAKVFAQYDYVVFGAGLEEPKHKYSGSTQQIITATKEWNPDTLFFGYIDLGVTTKYNFPLGQIEAKSILWQQLGADGIFLDDAGNDFGVDRKRLNTAVEMVHSLGMSAFVNAWDPDDVFASQQDDRYNPEGLETALGPNDYFLIESFLKPTNINDPNAESAYGRGFHKRMDKLHSYRKEYGTRLLSVSKIDFHSLSKNELRKFFRMNEAAAGVFSLNGYGIAAWDYSAGTTNRNIVQSLPYFENYMDYYDADEDYNVLIEGMDYKRAGFRLHSEQGKHFYHIPELYGS